MSEKMDPVAAAAPVRTDPQAPVEADGRSPACGAQLATVDIVAGGKLAVTRPRVPWIFRLLLLLTGVRV